MKLQWLPDSFTICTLKDCTRVNLSDEFVFLGKTDEELSLVCRSACAPVDCIDREDGWRALRICEGALDFALTGILAELSAILAKSRIGIFAVSTYRTDYILVKEQHWESAGLALERAGHQFIAYR